MCEYTNRRNDNEDWECPCPYRDRCERFSQNYGNRRNCNRREGQSNCADRRNSNRRNGCGICNLFRGCWN